MKVVNRELLVIERVLGNDLHVLGENFSKLLSDDTPNPDIVDVLPNLAPLIRIAVTANVDAFDSLEQSVVINVLDVFFDSHIGGILYEGCLNGSTCYDHVRIECVVDPR